MGRSRVPPPILGPVMTKRHALATAVATCHLLLVACSAARVIPAPTNIVEKSLRCYGEYSGAANGYGYFAPGVASQWGVTFSLYDKENNKWTDGPWSGDNNEVKLRIGTILSMFASDESREHLAASWAGMMFARHPKAKVVIVKSQVYILPSMAEYQSGERPHWEAVHVEAFAHEPEISGPEE